jgi:hypothetical protein
MDLKGNCAIIFLSQKTTASSSGRGRVNNKPREGRVEGKNYRRRPRLEYTEQIIKDVECKTYSEMKGMVEDRTGWRAASSQPKSS